MAKRDFYDVLGVSKGASEADIKKAYRRLARKLHPDVNPGDKAAQKRFQEVQEAYDVLKDSEKRRAYDRFGHAGPGFDPRTAGGPAGAGSGGPEPDLGGARGPDSRVSTSRGAISAISSATCSAGAAAPRPGRKRATTCAGRSRFRSAMRSSAAPRRSPSAARSSAPRARGPAESERRCAATCRGEGRRGRVRANPDQDSGRNAGRRNDSHSGKGRARFSQRIARRPLRRGARDAAFLLRAAGQRHPRRGSDHGQGGLRRRRDRRADHPRHGAREDSAGDAEPAAVPPARQGRQGPADRHRRGPPLQRSRDGAEAADARRNGCGDAAGFAL